MRNYAIALLVLLYSGIVFGQKPEFDKKDMEKRMEQLKAEKVAYFTSEMDLDSETAQKFWPVYNQYEAEKMQSHKEFRDLWDKYKDQQNSEQGLSDDDYLKFADSMVNAKVSKAELLKTYHQKYKAILSPEQLVKFYRAEEQFGREMIKKYRSHRSRKGIEEGGK